MEAGDGPLLAVIGVLMDAGKVGGLIGVVVGAGVGVVLGYGRQRTNLLVVAGAIGGYLLAMLLAGLWLALAAAWRRLRAGGPPAGPAAGPPPGASK